MASGDYTYNVRWDIDRDALPSGNADKAVLASDHSEEYSAIQDAIDLQVNTNNPVFAGTLSTGTIDGGTY